MRWFPWRRRPALPKVEIHIEKAREAIEAETERAKRGSVDAARARRVQRSLRQIREENHFAEIMRDALKP
jgi:hypothetical protein